MRQSNLDRVIALRHELHQHPELAGEEKWTKKRLYSFIKEHTALEIYDRGLWFYAVYRTRNRVADTVKIAFRADFDALKMAENLELPHKSQNRGISHKCGHDGHSAILAGLALEIDQQGAEADIFFLFQFGEENGSGAKECAVFIDENSIDAIYALHNMSDMACNAIYICDGITHYTSTGMIIELTGSPCHASEPEKGKNPARALAQIVLELEKITDEQSRTSAGEIFSTVIQVALGEEAFGISASKGRLLLTLRAAYEQELLALQQAIEQYVKQQAEQQQLQYSVQYMDYFPETRNHDESSNAVRQLRHQGFDVRELEQPFRTSEDFGYYLKKTKGAIFYLGNGYEYPAIHTSEYDFNDQIIATGVEAFKALIKEQLQISGQP